MSVYHKLIHGNMLNNYELGDIKPEEALQMGYKFLATVPKQNYENYDIYYTEDSTTIYEHLKEIKRNII